MSSDAWIPSRSSHQRSSRMNRLFRFSQIRSPCHFINYLYHGSRVSFIVFMLVLDNVFIYIRFPDIHFPDTHFITVYSSFTRSDENYQQTVLI